MTTLSIQLRDNKTAFLPGEETAGTVSWHLEQSPRALELRLFWYTKGRGITDMGIVETLRFESPELDGHREFRFLLPEGPYSFTGTLINLLWALELVVEPTHEVARADIVVSPLRREIVLPQLEPRNYAHQ